VIAIRVIGAVWFYHNMLAQVSGFHFVWLDANSNLIPTRLHWLFLFNAGDSFLFPVIAMLGYAHSRYVFLPAYPILIRFADLLVGDYWLGAFLVTQAFALASIVVFQLLAEQFMQPKEALYATFLMATFPYISVFTTLGYSEAVFLFSSLSTWYFYKKGRITTSSILAGLASVTRIYGFAIVLPMFLDMLKQKCYRKMLYVAIPVAFIGSWALFCYLSVGDPFASWTEEQTVYHVVGTNLSLAQTILSQLARGIPGTGLDPAVLVSFVLFTFLVVKTWQVDRLLWAYTVIMLSLLTFAVTSHITLLRYLSFIFPLWLTVKVRNPIVVVICIAFFVPVLLLLWLYVITVFFVG
jgi:hypothetical protein